MKKSNRLTLKQETLKKLNQNVQHNNGPRYISQLCNTKFQSCPECNPPLAKLE